MTRSLAPVIALAACVVVTIGCGFERKSSVLSPTSVTVGATQPVASSTVGTAATAPLVGGWSSTATPAPTAAALAGTSCADFKFQITTQTATNIFGTFTAACSGGMTLSGNISGLIDATGTTVAVTAVGTGDMPGVTACAFTLSGTGTVEDNGYTLRVPFTGNTCLGPVSGVEVLRKPQPAAAPPQVVFEAPTPVAPAANAHIATLRPKFTVTNAGRTGPVGSVSYQIEVANDEPFTSLVSSWTVSEQSGQTSFDMPRDLAYTKVYYWHVRASDPSATGPWSRTLALQVLDPPAPTPAPVSAGQDAIDLRLAVVSGGSPTDVASWPITARLTGLDFQASGTRVDFTARDGAGRWPDVVPPGWDGPLQYTLWMVVNINGRWYTSGGVEYWYGLDRSGGAPSRFTSNWYYSALVWGPLAQHQPTPGEQVGFFITAGDQRVKDVRAITARSQVVMVPFPSDGGAVFRF